MVTITRTPLPVVSLPDEQQAIGLLSLCCATYPVLAAREGDDSFSRLHQFQRALFFCAHARRVEEPQTGYHFTYWLAEARIFLEEHGYIGALTWAPLTAAVVCSGISFHPLDRAPFDLAFGLAIGEAVIPSTEWISILESGVIPKPVEPRGYYVRPRPNNIDVKITQHD